MACSAPQLRETSPRRRLVAAREAGALKRWRAPPLPRWCYFLGRIIATSAVGALAGAVTVAVGVCFYHAIPTVEAATLILILIDFPLPTAPAPRPVPPDPHRRPQRRPARATPARAEPGAPTARPALAAQPRDNSQST